MAAVLFILAKEIDHDPRLLFKLAGADIFLSDTENENILIRQEQPVPAYLKKRETGTLQQLSFPPEKRLQFPLRESYLPLISDILPKNSSFTDSGFIIRLTEFYHTVITQYSLNFYKSEERIYEDDKKNISPFVFSKITFPF